MVGWRIDVYLVSVNSPPAHPDGPGDAAICTPLSKRPDAGQGGFQPCASPQANPAGKGWSAIEGRVGCERYAAEMQLKTCESSDYPLESLSIL